LYMFFWVFPWRQIVFCRRFGTLCQVHLQRLDVEYEVYTIWLRGNTQKNICNIQNTAKIWNQKYKNYSFSLLIIMVAPTCFGITLRSSGSVSSAFWEMLIWGAVDRILWMGVLCLVTWCACTASDLSISQKALGTLNAETCMSYRTYLIKWMKNWCICWFFTHIFTGDFNF
jgi:hypothetical protein